MIPTVNNNNGGRIHGRITYNNYYGEFVSELMIIYDLIAAAAWVQFLNKRSGVGVHFADSSACILMIWVRSACNKPYSADWYIYIW